VGSELAAAGRLVLTLMASDGFLNNGGDAVVLLDANGAMVDEMAWTSAAPGDRTRARMPDGGAWAVRAAPPPPPPRLVLCLQPW
jgi:hypothetical protein